MTWIFCDELGNSTSESFSDSEMIVMSSLRRGGSQATAGW